VMSPVGILGNYNLDQWDGFAAERRVLLDRFAARPALNPLVITGDVHLFAAGDLHADPEDPATPVVATEIVGGSISSAGLLPASVIETVRAHPHLGLVDQSRRGYAVVDLDRRQARCRLRAVSTVMQPTAPVETLAEVVVESGRPGAHVT
jgi:alkaline phosphatase D